MVKVKRTFIATAIAASLFACTPHVPVDKRIANAQTYIEQGEPDNAIIELKNAISEAPKNAQARYLLGKLYLQSGMAVQAEKELERAKSLDETLADVNSLLARAYYLQTDADALDDMLSNSSELSDKDRVNVLVYKALVDISNGDLNQAESLIAQAHDISEENIYAKLGSAWLASTNEENWRATLESVEEILSQHPDFSDAILLKAHLIAALGDAKKAAETYGEYLKLHPHVTYVRLFQIRNQLYGEQYKEAQPLISDLLSRFPNNPMVNHLAAHLHFRQGNFEQAKMHADIAISGDAKDVVARMVSATSAYQLGRMEQAYNAFKPIEHMVPAGHPVHKIMTLVKLNLGYLDEAMSGLDSFENSTLDDTRMLQYAVTQFARLGDVTSAQNLLNKAQELEPDSAALQAQSGILKMHNGEAGGIEDIKSALEKEPAMSGANVTLLMELLKQGRVEEGMEIVGQWKDAAPQSDMPYMMEGMLYTKAEQFEQAEAAFEAALKLNKNNAGTLTYLGFLNAKNGQLDKSKDYYQRAVEIVPSSKALSGIALVNKLRGKPEETKTFLLNELDKKPDNSRLAVAAALLMINGDEKAEGVKMLEEFNQQNPAEPRVSLLLADIYRDRNQPEKALTMYERTKKNFPDSPILALRIIGAYNDTGQYEEGLKLANQTLERYPDSTQVLLLKSHFHVILNQLEEAEKTLALIDKRYSQGEFYSKIEGNLAQRKQDFQQSVDAFYTAYSSKPSLKNAANLARALVQTNQIEEAVTTMENFVENAPDDRMAKMLLADFYKDADQREKSSEIYRAMLEGDPENPVILNNLAWNEMKLGNLDEALKYGEKAIDAAPEVEPIVDTYASILIANEKFDEALVLMERFMRDKATNSSFTTRYTYAKVLIANKQSDEARRVIRTLDPDNAEQKEMINHLMAQL